MCSSCAAADDDEAVVVLTFIFKVLFFGVGGFLVVGLVIALSAIAIYALSGGNASQTAADLPAVSARVPIIVGDLDAGFLRGGPGKECPTPGTDSTAWNWCWDTTNHDGDTAAGHYWYTDNGVGGDLNFGRWTPDLPLPGSYRVCAWIPANHAGTHDARYVVTSANGASEIDKNQGALSGWTDLGVYQFAAGTTGNVYLGDGTDEPWGTAEIGFGAMEWVPDAGGC